MRELFENQLNSTKPLTEDLLSRLQLKTYFNGEEKKVGDIMLYALLMGDLVEKENQSTELPLKIITLKEEHLHLLEPCEGFNTNSDLPVLKLKSQK